MNKILLVLILAAPTTLFGKEIKNCFYRHMVDALTTNKVNRKYYQELTNGESDKIYFQLMTGERIGKVLARPYEKRVKPYIDAGMDLFCQEFKEMPKLGKPEIGEPIDEEFIQLPMKALRLDLKRAIKSDDFEKALKISREGLKFLNRSPHYHCMTKHILESIVRLVVFYPKRKLEASSKGLPDPYQLFKDVIRSHLSTLPGSGLIDRMSYPLQKAGVPILCRELPNLLEDL